MSKDFTVSIYKELLSILVGADFSFQAYSEFVKKLNEKVIILRHDVDARKEQSLQFAKIQHHMGIIGTYYFRMAPQSFDKKVIRDIASLGHEIGYHYETMDKANGDVEKAYDLFCRELEQLREIVPVKTICMHGSPLSRYDNRDLWKHYDYRELGIIGEPYFDLDFNKVLYLTDTGRRWDGEKVSIRDRVPAKREIPNSKLQNSTYPAQDSGLKTQDYHFHSTQDIIDAIQEGTFPDKAMLTFHPQRWTDKPLPWLRELLEQSIKNLVKRGVNRYRKG